MRVLTFTVLGISFGFSVLAAHDPFDHIDEYVFPVSTFEDGGHPLDQLSDACMATLRSFKEQGRKFFTESVEEWQGQTKLEQSDGLIVFLHGLGDGPEQWSLAIDRLKEFDEGYFRNYAIYTPKMPFRGDADTETISKPFMDALNSFISLEQTSTKPIILIGTSNGGRLALHLANRFADIQNPLFVASIAGAHYGSQVLSFANDLGLGWIIGGPDIQRDLAFGSEQARETIQLAQSLHISKLNRAFLFISTNNDGIVRGWNYSPTHPKLNSGRAKHVHISGHGHWSVPNGAFPQVLADIQFWRESEFSALTANTNSIRDCFVISSFLESTK